VATQRTMFYVCLGPGGGLTIWGLGSFGGDQHTSAGLHFFVAASDNLADFTYDTHDGCLALAQGPGPGPRDRCAGCEYR
jgi:hypothetical protein